MKFSFNQMLNYLAIIRRTSTSISLKTFIHSPNKLFFRTYSSQTAEKFMNHLQKTKFQLEKSLNTVGAKPDSPCITEVLKRCATDKPQLGLRFFIWASLQPNYWHTSYMYSKACEILEIEKNPRVIYSVINEYKDEDVVVSIKMFRVVLNLCKAAKDANLGLWVLRKMKEFRVRPDTVSYNVVIRLLVEKGELNGARGLMKEMSLIDLYPDNITYVSLIKGFCDVGRLDDACELVKVMKEHGCVPNAIVYNTLLDGMCMHGTLEMASKFLGELEKEGNTDEPNVVSYTTMIKGFVEKRRAKEAVSFLDRMVESGLKPNKVTMVTLLDGLCKEGNLEEAYKVIHDVSEGGLCYDQSKLLSLLVISMLKSGMANEAETMFRMMISRGMRPNGLASSSIIKMKMSNGQVLDGFCLFESLEKLGFLKEVDSNFYSIILASLCKEKHFAEVAKILDVIVQERISLNSPHAEYLIEHLKISGEHDLASVAISIYCK